MEASLLLAKLWGLYLTLIVLALIINRDTLKRIFKLAHDEGFLFITGFLSLIMGLTTVLLHNVWTFDWRGIVTVIGWIAIIKGVSRFIMPGQIVKSAEKFEENKALLNVSFFVMLIIGLYLTYSGFQG